MDGNNDNEKFSFIALAAATANVVRYLCPDEKKNEEGAADGDGSRRDEEKRSSHEEYVEQRLKELRAFERRARGQR